VLAGPGPAFVACTVITNDSAEFATALVPVTFKSAAPFGAGATSTVVLSLFGSRSMLLAAPRRVRPHVRQLFTSRGPSQALMELPLPGLSTVPVSVAVAPAASDAIDHSEPFGVELTGVDQRNTLPASRVGCIST
jgi:hypothetical protein